MTGDIPTGVISQNELIHQWEEFNQQSGHSVGAESLESVNSPAHYNQGQIECIEAIESLGGGEPFCRFTCLKYLWRYPDKGNALEDLKKARWYLDRLISYYEK